LAAFVDYPDDDIPELSPNRLSELLHRADTELTALLSSYEAGRVLREGVDTVIVGSPNVGKSTLMNLLSGCERSIVTAIPGTTRDIVEETVRLGEVTLRLADTAGIRATGDEVEGIGVKLAQARLKSAALVLAVFDGSRPLTDDDRMLAQSASSMTAIAVVNKGDMRQNIDVEYLRSVFPYVVCASAQNGEGVDTLERAVAEVTGLNRLDAAQPVLANERQRNCVVRCRDGVREALAALDNGITLDAVNICIDDAVSALLEMIGERTTEAVVNEVFARFCVGK